MKKYVIILASLLLLMNTKTIADSFEYSYKKAVYTLSQALELHYALEGKTAKDYNSSQSLTDNVFKKRLSIKNNTANLKFTTNACKGSSVFQTNDDILFCIDNFSNTACDEENTKPCIKAKGPNVWIDINGYEGPNIKNQDIFEAQIYAQNVKTYK